MLRDLDAARPPVTTRSRRGWPVLVVMALGLASCAGEKKAASPAPPPPPPPPAAASQPTTTARPGPTTTTLPGLGKGARGPEVLALERRLVQLRYDPGRVDGVFDGTTHHAVTAFQKVQGLARTGRATPDVLSALAAAGTPPPLVPGGGSLRVEIDLKRQVLFLYQGDGLARILPVSSGNEKRYCVDGACARAVTPGGSFRVGRKIRGLRVSRLGQLYNPLYFNGGIAIHGSNSVPPHPASHGCVRIPMVHSLWFFDTVPSGTPVYVVGGRTAPVPFDEPEPTDDSPSPPPTRRTSPTTGRTTSTTVPVLP